MDTYGPALPPGFTIPDNDEDSESEGEPRPKKKVKVIGPKIPAFLSSKQSDKDSDSPEEGESQSPKIIGPVLPRSLAEKSGNNDDDEVYGPMPSETNMDYDVVNMIEKRAVNMRNKLDNKDLSKVDAIQREEWMVVPDTSRRNQLGAISRCLAPGAKVPKKEADSYHNSEQDKKTSEKLKKYNKSKRGESLLDMHIKKKKKEKKKEKKSKKEERKAFDRDEIATRHFNKKQVNSVIEKSKYLNSRFAASKTQQFL